MLLLYAWFRVRVRVRVRVSMLTLKVPAINGDHFECASSGHEAC